jgi:hypothetical protein
MLPQWCFVSLFLFSWVSGAWARKQDEDSEDYDFESRKSARMRRAVLDVEQSFEKVVQKDLHDLGEKMIAKMEKISKQDESAFEDSEVKREQHSLRNALPILGHHRGLPTPPPAVATGIEDNENPDNDDPDTEDPEGSDTGNVQPANPDASASLLDESAPTSREELGNRHERILAQVAAKAAESTMRREIAPLRNTLQKMFFQDSTKITSRTWWFRRERMKQVKLPPKPLLPFHFSNTRRLVKRRCHHSMAQRTSGLWTHQHLNNTEITSTPLLKKCMKRSEG